MVLAHKFGGTPWAWRRQHTPDPCDWGTAVKFIQQEQEELEAAQHG